MKDAFLRLVRLGLGHSADALLDRVDWVELQTLTWRQGLSAVVLDGLDVLVSEGRLPRDLDLEPMQKKMWIGQVLQNYEYRYELYRRAIAEMAAFYNAHGFRMMVLKGYACSLDWPNPEHRPTGDIDIWQFGRYREADAALASEKGISVDSSHHHHTVFYWRDFMVENHYDFINVHHHRSNAEYEKILKKLGEDDSQSVELCGVKVYLPSPNLHALFLLKHMMLHFASGEISVRQLLDWGFFVEKHGEAVDWPYVMVVLEKFGMRELFEVFNAICVEDLGFDGSRFNFVDSCHDSAKQASLMALAAPRVQVLGFTSEVDRGLKERVLDEILSPEFGGETPSALIPRIAFKYRRWRANEWKHRLCYKESMWSAFWSGVWNHLLKPSSI